MTTLKSLSLRILLGLGGLLGAGLAQASCSLETPTIILAPYNALGPAPIPANVSFSLKCTENTVVQIQASAGNSGNLLSRQLRQGTNAVAYNLYVGSTATTVWGDGTSSTSPIGASVAANTPLQIVGNILVRSGQNPVPGIYTDVLMFTVVY